MAEFSWVATTPLSRALVAGHHGAAGSAGLSMSELTDFDLVQVMARRGQWERRCEGRRTPFRRGGSGKAAGRAGGRIVADLVRSRPVPRPVRADRRRLGDGGGEAVVCRRSFAVRPVGRARADPHFRRAGARHAGQGLLARPAPTAFPVGTAAATSIDHTSVNLWRGEDADGSPVFNLLVFTSFAESLWHTLLDSGAEYGIEIAAPGAWQP